MNTPIAERTITTPDRSPRWPRRIAAVLGLTASTLVVAGCGGQIPDLRPTVTKTVTVDATPDAQPTVTITETVEPTASPTTTDEAFDTTGEVSELTDEDIQAMTGITLRPEVEGCAKPEALRIVTVPYRTPDDESKRGQLVVHKDIADDTKEAFERIYDDVPDFRIVEIARPEDKIQGVRDGREVDEIMMENNITSGYNCRKIAGSDKISEHGLGLAFDINPLNNPAVKPGINTKLADGQKRQFDPPAGEAEFDNPTPSQALRSDSYPGNEVIATFEGQGFEWGGRWKTLSDLQHFESK